MSWTKLDIAIIIFAEIFAVFAFIASERGSLSLVLSLNGISVFIAIAVFGILVHYKKLWMHKL